MRGCGRVTTRGSVYRLHSSGHRCFVGRGCLQLGSSSHRPAREHRPASPGGKGKGCGSTRAGGGRAAGQRVGRNATARHAFGKRAAARRVAERGGARAQPGAAGRGADGVGGHLRRGGEGRGGGGGRGCGAGPRPDARGARRAAGAPLAGASGGGCGAADDAPPRHRAPASGPSNPEETSSLGAALPCLFTTTHALHVCTRVCSGHSRSRRPRTRAVEACARSCCRRCRRCCCA